MPIYTGTPKSWGVEEELTSANFNAEIRDPLLALTGADTAYTPTIGGFTTGNGTATGAYSRVGKRIYFYARLTFGSTSAAASAVITMTLPVTSNGVAGFFVGEFYDASASTYYRAGTRQGSTTTVALYVQGTNGVMSAPSTTSPFTWTTSDTVSVWGVYTAA